MSTKKIVDTDGKITPLKKLQKLQLRGGFGDIPITTPGLSLMDNGCGKDMQNCNATDSGCGKDMVNCGSCTCGGYA